MAEAWFVRVQEREYGPVDLPTLREWKSEGRLIPENPVRAADNHEWSTAAGIPGLFAAPEAIAHPTSGADPLFRRRSFGALIGESCRIFAKGFLTFFPLALFVGIPSLGFKLSLSYIHYTEGEAVTTTTRIASAVAIVMAAAVLAAWPIFIAGLQFAAERIARGERPRLGEVLQRAVNHWPRIARLSLFVYGS